VVTSLFCDSGNAHHMRHVAPLSPVPQSIAHTSRHHGGVLHPSRTDNSKRRVLPASVRSVLKIFPTRRVPQLTLIAAAPKTLPVY
jgi:hypothetical protein